MTNEKRKVMELALEALEAYQHNGSVQLFDVAVAELRQAIANMEAQEPVACPYCHNSHTLGAVYFDQNCVNCVKQMTRPQPAA